MTTLVRVARKHLYVLAVATTLAVLLGGGMAMVGAVLTGWTLGVLWIWRCRP